MKTFQQLADLVDRLWNSRNDRPDAFSEVAAQALAQMELERKLDMSDLLKRLPFGDWPRPVAGENDYGDPTITVHRGPRFRIEVICWRQGATQIHEHNSSGAFVVVAGARLHSEYAFELDEPIGPRLSTGRLVPRSCEVLHPGDIREIFVGDRFIHALCFIDKQCLTVSIRAPAMLSDALLYSPPYLASARPDLELGKKLRGLAYLRDFRRTEFHAAALEMISSADALSAFNILVQLKRDLTEEAFVRLLRTARRKHGGWIDLVDASLTEENRRSHAVEVMRRLKKFEHRFLLALLWHGSSREAIFDVVQRSYPHKLPARTIARWVDGVAKDLNKLGAADLLGREWDDLMAIVFRSLLDRLPFEAMTAKLEQSYSARDLRQFSPQLSLIYDSIKQGSLFAPLWQ